MKLISYSLSILLLVSIGFNVKFYFALEKTWDDYWLNISESRIKEIQLLKNIDESTFDKTKELLNEQIEDKTFFLTLCLKEKCISDSGLEKLKQDLEK